MRKTTTSICISPDVLEVAKQKGINISQTMEDLLRGFLLQKKDRTRKDIQKDMDKSILKHNTEMIILQNELSEIDKAEDKVYQKERTERKKKLLREAGINV